MMGCKQASQLASQGLDTKLSIRDRFALNFIYSYANIARGLVNS